MDTKAYTQCHESIFKCQVVERRISIKDRNHASGTIPGGRYISEVQDKKESIMRRTSFITKNMLNRNWKTRDTHDRKLRDLRPEIEN